MELGKMAERVDIFVSYAHEDQPRVAKLVRALEREGWRVFWDRDVPPGSSWRRHIGTRLEASSVVIVVWSQHSLRSDFVESEADRALLRDALVPVLFDAVRPPLGFAHLAAADLVKWITDGDDRPIPSALSKVLGQRIQDGRNHEADGSPFGLDQDRVLLRFRKENVEKAGTFEHDIQKIIQAAPDESDRRNIVYNPRGILNSAEFRLSGHESQKKVTLVAMAISWAILLPMIVMASTSEWWLLAITVVCLAVLTIVFGELAREMHQEAQRERRRRDVAKEYLGYLDTNEILLQIEFTQSRRMRDRPLGKTFQ